MVYQVRCDNCDDLIDFGGHDPEDLPVGDFSKIPDDAIKFDGNVYCEDCVKEFVKMGVGDIENKVDFLEEQVEDIREELGMEKNMND